MSLSYPESWIWSCIRHDHGRAHFFHRSNLFSLVNWWSSHSPPPMVQIHCLICVWWSCYIECGMKITSLAADYREFQFNQTYSDQEHNYSPSSCVNYSSNSGVEWSSNEWWCCPNCSSVVFQVGSWACVHNYLKKEGGKKSGVFNRCPDSSLLGESNPSSSL